MRTVDQMIQNEVVYCISSLAADMAALEPDSWLDLFGGYRECPECDGGLTDENEACLECVGGEQLVEVFEHWIVSNWLADRLEEKGEIIERDFHGLVVWGRTTTGQSISMDYVIEQIYQDSQRPANYDKQVAGAMARII